MRRNYWHRWLKGSRCGRSFWADRRGVTAIEFAFVALPFLALAFGIIEVGLTGLANRMVDNAVISASRLIKTGQAQSGNISASEFKSQVCGFMPSFMCVEGRLFVDVTSVSTFSDAQGSDSLYDDQGNIKDEFNYNSGGAGDIIVVNVVYKWPMMISFLGLDGADRGSERHLTSTMVFRNEPWE